MTGYNPAPLAAANITMTATDDGFLVTADARKPAPEFGAALHSLAHPDPYAGLSADTRRRLDEVARILFKGKSA